MKSIENTGVDTIKRKVLAAGWAAPMISVVSLPLHAQTSPDPNILTGFTLTHPDPNNCLLTTTTAEILDLIGPGKPNWVQVSSFPAPLPDDGVSVLWGVLSQMEVEITVQLYTQGVSTLGGYVAGGCGGAPGEEASFQIAARPAEPGLWGYEAFTITYDTAVNVVVPDITLIPPL